MTRKGTVRPPLPKILTDSNGATTLRGGDEGGGGELHFHLLKSVKRQKGPLGCSASTNFVADCIFLILKSMPFVKAWMSAPYPPHYLSDFVASASSVPDA